MQKSNFTVWIASLLAFVGGSIVLLFVCFAVSSVVNITASEQNSGRVLVPTTTPLPAATNTAVPTKTYEERKASAVNRSYHALLGNSTAYTGKFLKIRGRVFKSAGTNTEWEAWINNSPIGYSKELAIVICLNCGVARPAYGDSLDLIGLPTGEESTVDYPKGHELKGNKKPKRITYVSRSAPVLWVAH